MNFSYPIVLDLTNRPCLVVGGGKVAQRKVTSLLKAGAAVTVVSPQVTETINDLHKKGRIAVVNRAFQPQDLDGQFILFGALNDPSARAELAAEAKKRGIPANLADDPQNCDFIIPSSFRGNDLLVAVSTNGRSPALSRKLRQVLEAKIGPSFALQVEAMGEIRDRLFNDIPDREDLRREVFLGIVDSDLLDVLRHGDEETFNSRVDALIARAMEKAAGHE